jgi:hypothetical protein
VRPRSFNSKVFSTLHLQPNMPFTEEKDISDSRDQDRPSSSDDLEDCPSTGEDHSFPHRRRRWISWPANDSAFWKYYALFATAFALLMLVTTIHNSTSPRGYHEEREPSTPAHAHDAHDALEGYSHPADSWKKDNLAETRFFRDLRYMSLDPDSDYLWKEHLFMNTGNIQLPDGKGNTSLQGIAMFHQMHCLAKMRFGTVTFQNCVVPRH